MGTLKFRVLNSPLKVPVGVGLIAFAAGSGVGYLLGRRSKMEAHQLPDINWGEGLSDRVHSIMSKRGTTIIPPAPDVVVPKRVVVDEEELSKRRREERDAKIEIIPQEDDDEPELVNHSVFAGSDSEWDYEEEKKKRSPDQPYVLHKDEFYSDERSFTQSTLTYYEGDNILCDEANKPIYNHDAVTGPLLFGHGSGSPSVVYVRNEKLRAEYEILRDSGLYSVEVLGLEIENNERAKHIQHSRHRKLRFGEE